jgi:hypothetical protein
MSSKAGRPSWVPSTRGLLPPMACAIPCRWHTDSFCSARCSTSAMASCFICTSRAPLIRAKSLAPGASDESTQCSLTILRVDEAVYLLPLTRSGMGTLLDCIFYPEGEDDPRPPVRVIGWPFQSLATAGDPVNSQPSKPLWHWLLVSRCLAAFGSVAAKELARLSPLTAAVDLWRQKRHGKPVEVDARLLPQARARRDRCQCGHRRAGRT